VGFDAPAIAVVGNVVNLHGILAQSRPQSRVEVSG
jgi:hypothetical protein